jgi:hypothetical protein
MPNQKNRVIVKEPADVDFVVDSTIQAQAADNDSNLSFRWEGDNDDLEKILSEIEHEHL